MRTDDVEEDIMIHHGMITSEPYAFNDSYPTALVQDRRGTGKKKSGRRKWGAYKFYLYLMQDI